MNRMCDLKLMIKRVQFCAGMLFCIGLMPATFADDLNPGRPEVPVMSWDKQGMTLKWNGTDVFADAAPRADMVLLQTRTVNEKDGYYDYEFHKASLENSKKEVDPGAKTIARHYDWGTIRSQYRLEDNALRIRFTVENNADLTIANFRFYPCRLKKPELPDFKPRKRHKTRPLVDTTDRPIARAFNRGPGKVYVSYEAFEHSVFFGFDDVADNNPEKAPLVLSGGTMRAPAKGDYTIPPHGNPYIPAGESMSFEIVMRFAGKEEFRHWVLKDFYKAYREFSSPLLDWPDRRPIGQVFTFSEYGKQAPQFGQEGSNPRRWWSPYFDTSEMDSPHARDLFRDVMRGLGRNTARSLKLLDAQGMIMWSSEGSYHSTGYVGDPRMASILSPEIDNALDLFFNEIRKEGFRTGLTLRHTQLTWRNNKWVQGAGNFNPLANPFMETYPDAYPQPHVQWWEIFPVAERFIRKIDYAKKRWGCSIFYIDTSIVTRPLGLNRRFGGRLISSVVWKKVREAHPDVLIVPELHKRGRYIYGGVIGQTAPYGQLGYGRVRPYIGPEETRDIFPTYFGYNNVADGDIFTTVKQRVRETAWGEILAINSWGFDPNKGYGLREIYAKAERKQARFSKLARRFGVLEAAKDVVPLSYAIANAKYLNPLALVKERMRHHKQLRAFTASNADKSEAMFMLQWAGWPNSPDEMLKSNLVGVEVEGKYKHVWDIRTGDLISSTEGVHVPADPIYGLRGMIVRGSDKPLPSPRPDGVRMTASFNNGLKPDSGAGLLTDNGDAELTDGMDGKGIRLGKGQAKYSTTPQWFSGTIELDLKVDSHDGEPVPVLRMQHQMDAGLELVQKDGQTMLRFYTYERPGHGYFISWTDPRFIMTHNKQKPVLREKFVPLPDNDHEWHHIVLAWEVGQYRMFVDGKLSMTINNLEGMLERDHTILEPGLIVGGEHDGQVSASVDSLRVYDWSFSDAIAKQQKAPDGMRIVAKPSYEKPSVYMWGSRPDKIEKIAINWRKAENGLRARRFFFELSEESDNGWVQVCKGTGHPRFGVSTFFTEEEPGVEDLPIDEVDLTEKDSEKTEELMGIDESLMTVGKKYRILLKANTLGEAPPEHEIIFEFGADKKAFRYWNN